MNIQSYTLNGVEQDPAIINAKFSGVDVVELKKRGDCLRYGYGVPMNKAEAFENYKEAAQWGYMEAILCCGDMLKNGEGVKIDRKTASLYYKKAAENLIPDGLINFGELIDDDEVKLACFQKALELGDKRAYSRLGIFYSYNKLSLSIQYFQKGIELGDAQSMNEYAGIVLNSHVPGVPPKKGNDYYKMAIDLGLPIAMINLADNYASGNHIKKDKVEALRLYKMAVDTGAYYAIHHYAEALRNGIGTNKNPQEAIRYLKMGMERGDDVSYFDYAKMVEKGEGVKADKDEALRCYKKAYNLGYYDAKKEYNRLVNKSQCCEIY